MPMQSQHFSSPQIRSGSLFPITPKLSCTCSCMHWYLTSLHFKVYTKGGSKLTQLQGMRLSNSTCTCNTDTVVTALLAFKLKRHCLGNSWVAYITVELVSVCIAGFCTNRWEICNAFISGLLPSNPEILQNINFLGVIGLPTCISWLIQSQRKAYTNTNLTGANNTVMY